MKHRNIESVSNDEIKLRNTIFYSISGHSFNKYKKEMFQNSKKCYMIFNPKLVTPLVLIYWVIIVLETCVHMYLCTSLMHIYQHVIRHTNCLIWSWCALFYDTMLFSSVSLSVFFFLFVSENWKYCKYIC